MSNLLPRRIELSVQEDLQTKMVFVAGPRQCGKTTLAERLLDRLGGAYFNWDDASHRRALRERALPEEAPLWVFDELHKMRAWRGWLKGVVDLDRKRHQKLVMGSARLDAYGRGGDSLQGRYLMTRMHPFTLSEFCGVPALSPDEVIEFPLQAPRAADEHLDALLRLGGFPEPLLSSSERQAGRWRLAYGTRLVREEIRELEALQDLDKVELLFDRIPSLVGSQLSLNALREDLEVAFATVASWMTILEKLYAVFRVAPFGTPRIKAVKKTAKAYCWDWARVEDPGARFENLVMFHLLRFVHYLEDVHGEKAELRYVRDVVGHEVDALVLRKGRPWLAVEIKLDDRPLAPGLVYLLKRVAVPYAVQVSLRGSVHRRLEPVGKTQIRAMPAATFLTHLP
ncbi:MAG: AAA family ATPase [Deltaproteobacteria bacterium]